jgi:hypothetical protein
VRREQLEALVLQRTQVLRADLRRVLELREVELLAQARLAEALADLEHAPIVAGRCASRASAKAEALRARFPEGGRLAASPAARR